VDEVTSVENNLRNCAMPTTTPREFAGLRGEKHRLALIVVTKQCRRPKHVHCGFSALEHRYAPAYRRGVHGTGEYVNEEACSSNHRVPHTREYRWLCHPTAALLRDKVTKG
jgi:hypothetical protein